MKKNKCLLLFKAQLKDELSRNFKKKGDIFKIAILLFMGILIIYFSYYLSHLLSKAGLAETLPSIGITITSLFILLFTILKTNGILFAYKEYDTLMSLPIKTSAIISSRFLTMYALNMILSILVMFPIGVAYVQWCNPNIIFYLEWLVGIVTIPLIPTCFASLVGILIILGSSKFKNSNAMTTIFFIPAIIAILGIPVLSEKLGGFSINPADIKSISELLLHSIDNIYLPSSLFYAGIVKQNIFKMALFIISSFVLSYIFIKVISIYYKKLNTSLTTHYTKTIYKLADIHPSNKLIALYKKEIRRFFSSPMYCLNMGIGTVLVAVIAIGCFFVHEKTMNILLQPFGANGNAIKTFPFAIGTLISITCTTCVSLSLEGKNLWIIKSLPLSDADVYKSKILFNLTLQIPSVLLAAICWNIHFTMPMISRILVLITPLAFALFSTVFGMFMNIKMPNYDWTSEVTLIKRGTPTICLVAGSLLIGCGISYISTKFQGNGFFVYIMFITFFLYAGAWFLWNYLKKQKI